MEEREMELEMSEVDIHGSFEHDSEEEDYPPSSLQEPSLKSANSTITIPVSTYQGLQFGVVCLVLTLALTVFFVFTMVVVETGDKENSDSNEQISYGEGHLSSKELRELAISVNSSINFDVDPCTDFYQFSCGQWIEDNKDIPPDRSAWYKSFSLIDSQNEEILGKILEDDWPLLGTFYQNCMDMDTRDEVGTTPLTPFLDQIAELEDGDREGLARLLAELHKKGVAGLFSTDIDPSFMDPTTNILYLDQGGMGMPSRDYYFGTSEHDVHLQEEYQRHAANLFQLAGHSGFVEVDVGRVYELEKRLAEHALGPTERRDPYALYNIYTMGELGELSPGFEWGVYFGELGIDLESVTSLDVVEPLFVGNVSDLIDAQEGDFQGIRDYLALRSIVAASSWLTTGFVEEVYRWYETLTGASQPPNERICLGRVSSILGELLGRYYVNAVFDDRSKKISLDMIQRIEEAFVANLDDVEWMDDQTAELAVEKMKKITNKIGYPDKWRSYGKLEVIEGDFYGTHSSYIDMMFEEEIHEVNKPVDKSKWFMTPQTVNAYYNPPGNEIVFPAAILQPTFFDRTYPIPFNFGGIGMVMGHELSHGFDDQGRQFNGDGQLVQWWSDEATENFDDAAQCVVDLYGGYSLELDGEDYSVNGHLTLGENIADLGGVTFAFNAYRELREGQEERRRRSEAGELDEDPVEWPYYPEKDIQKTFGFSSDQLFFLSMAQNWCSVVRDDRAIQLIQTNPHSPDEFRVNGPMSQTPQFAEAFSCPVDTPMHPESHCKVW